LQLKTHEPWRDEWQAWAIARDSRSVGELFHNIRYEGHPPLWFLVLFGLSRFTRDIIAMRVISAVTGVVATALIVRFAPLSKLERALYSFGYFAAFEYLAISRSYGLGVALVVGYAVATWSRPSPPIVRGGLLA